jgi:hypothetical protein
VAAVKPSTVQTLRPEPSKPKAAAAGVEVRAQVGTARHAAATGASVETPKPVEDKRVEQAARAEPAAIRPAKPKGTLAERIAQMELEDAPGAAEPRPTPAVSPVDKHVVKPSEPVAKKEVARSAGRLPVQPIAQPESAAAHGAEPTATESADPAAKRKAVLEKMQARLRSGASTTEFERTDPKHKDARRIARLFASEIILYNQEKVELGRKQGGLYQILQNDIDHCRETIRERIPEDVALQFDYLYDEIVLQIAQGDESKLGPGMPAPTAPRKKS